MTMEEYLKRATEIIQLADKMNDAFSEHRIIMNLSDSQWHHLRISIAVGLMDENRRSTHQNQS